MGVSSWVSTMRQLVRNPAQAASMLVLLSFGIGVNFAVAILLEAVIFRATPLPEPDRVVLLWGDVQREQRERRGASLPDYFDWKSESDSFSALAAWWGGFVTMRGDSGNERVPVEYVDFEYFAAIGLEPALGRGFTGSEAFDPGQSRSVILNHNFWRDRFAQAGNVLGRRLEIDGQAYTVVGVAPRGFAGLTDAAQLFLPLAADPAFADMRGERGARWFAAVGRLREGRELSAAASELSTICSRLEAAYPGSNQKRSVEVAPLEAEVAGDLRRAFTLVFCATLAILCLALANVVNLVLVRTEKRTRELAVRRSLGASNKHLMAELLRESILLVAMAAGGGYLIASLLVGLVSTYSPVPLPSFLSLNPGVWSWTYLAGVAILLALTLAVTPYAKARRGGLHLSSRNQGAMAGSSRSAARSTLVAGEVALGVLLVAATFLFAGSFRRMAEVDPGFRTDNSLSMNVSLPVSRPPASSAADATEANAVPQPRFRFAELKDALESLPGVTKVAFSSNAPLRGPSGAIFYTAQGFTDVSAESRPRAYIQRVSPEFFECHGIPLVAGSTFTQQSPENAVVVSQALVARFWPGESGIGNRIKAGGPGSSSPWMEIIGVVPNLCYRGLPENPTADPDVFVRIPDTVRAVTVSVATQVPPEPLLSSVGDRIRGLHPESVVFQADTIRDRVANQLALPRFLSWVLSGIALLSIVLAGSGIYAVAANAVMMRKNEIGVRMALGAAPLQVLTREIWGATKILASGCGAGAVGFLLISRVFASQVYGAHGGYPQVLVSAIAVLMLLGLAATWEPARKASRTNPLDVLRSE